MNTRAVTHIHAPPQDGTPVGTEPGRLKTGGQVQKPPGMSWRDHLIMLLQTGAEIEHCLMVQYLFAAYSLNEDQPTEELRQKVRGWRETILTVAKEEMGHLLTVQNLLCLIGGPISFERANFPWDTRYLPFPFKLEKLSAVSMGWYLFAEAPLLWADPTANQKTRDELKAALSEVNQLAAKAAAEDLAHTVGQLYEEIFQIVANEQQIPDSTFRAETYAQQASWDDWGRGYRPPPAPPGATEAPKEGRSRAHVLIMRAATRTDALAALKEVGGQGEAAHFRDVDSDEPSHFKRFLELLTDLNDHPDFDPVHNVAENPTVLDAGKIDDRSTPIEAVNSRRIAHLFNNRYRALLVCLAHSYKLAPLVNPDEPNVRGAIMHHIFGEMYNLKALSGLLVRMPLQDAPDPQAPRLQSGIDPRVKTNKPPASKPRPYDASKRAAPPFDMPYSMHIPNDEIDRWRHYQDIVRNSQTLCQELLDKNDPHSQAFAAAFPEGVRFLRTLSQLDQKAVTWIDTVLAGFKRR